MAQCLEELDEVTAEERKFGSLARYAEHAADLPDRHLHADPGEKPDEHGPGQKIGEKAQSGRPGNPQQRTGQERAQASQRDPVRRRRLQPGDPECGDAGIHDGGRGRVCTNDEVPRRTEHRKGDDRDEDGVKARDDRHPGDLGVAHDLRDGKRGQGDAGDDVLAQPPPVVRANPLKHRDVHGVHLIELAPQSESANRVDAPSTTAAFMVGLLGLCSGSVGRGLGGGVANVTSAAPTWRWVAGSR